MVFMILSFCYFEILLTDFIETLFLMMLLVILGNPEWVNLPHGRQQVPYGTSIQGGVPYGRVHVPYGRTPVPYDSSFSGRGAAWL